MSVQKVLRTASPEMFEEALRTVEALLFAASEPLTREALAERLPKEVDIDDVLQSLSEFYAGRGVNLVKVAGRWAFRTAPDLATLLVREQVEQRKLSRAAMETLAILAYHQPVTRAEIESIRGVSTSKGTLDVLIETGWARMRGRRKAPGRPVTYGTTQAFLEHFGLADIGDLPGLAELRGAGFFDGQLPAGFDIPAPTDSPQLHDDEDPIDDEELRLDVEGAAAGEDAAAEGEGEETTDDSTLESDEADSDELDQPRSSNDNEN
ncbi:SMC-Scp complex subunit ScpB [Terrarubrum flagellatum]|uniref:SMC-Scp complex subunit ScpB n=1 Tax=Terrirubrum flagellatum TaxID=2895980 RepID=UPI0031452092